MIVAKSTKSPIRISDRDFISLFIGRARNMPRSNDDFRRDNPWGDEDEKRERTGSTSKY
jgi:hypothetical protein